MEVFDCFVADYFGVSLVVIDLRGWLIAYLGCAAFTPDMDFVIMGLRCLVGE